MLERSLLQDSIKTCSNGFCFFSFLAAILFILHIDIIFFAQLDNLSFHFDARFELSVLPSIHGSKGNTQKLGELLLRQNKFVPQFFRQFLVISHIAPLLSFDIETYRNHNSRFCLNFFHNYSIFLSPVQSL